MIRCLRERHHLTTISIALTHPAYHVLSVCRGNSVCDFYKQLMDEVVLFVVCKSTAPSFHTRCQTAVSQLHVTGHGNNYTATKSLDLLSMSDSG